MKHNPFSYFAAALAASALLSSARAGVVSTLYWDDGAVVANGVSAGGSGAWTIGAPGWEDGVTAQNWADGSAANLGGTAGTLTLGGPISAAGVTVNTTGYTLALANNTLATASLNYGGPAAGTLTVTGGNGTTSAQNTLTVSGSGTGWTPGTSVNLTGSGNPAVGSTQNGPLLKLVLGNPAALGSAELKVRHAMIQTGSAGMTVTNDITNAGASLYFGGEFDFTVSGLIRGDVNNNRTIGVWSGSNGSRTITLGNLDTVGTGTLNFEARGGAVPNPGGGFIVNGVISGAGGVSTVGTGQFAGNILTLNGANTYTGATTMLSGRLQLNGSLTSPVSVSSPASISGPGSTTGLLTFNAGSKLALAGGATTTSLTSAGVNFAGAPNVVFDAPPVPSTVYDVLTYGSGPVTNPGNLKVGFRGTLTDTGTKFTFTAGQPGQTRTWNVTDGIWDIGTSPNWLEGDNLFFNGDNVIFGNPAADSVVTLTGALAPASVTVANVNSYTFGGTGSIVGSSGLAKSGSGVLAIASQQSYTGGTTVDGGVLNLTGGGGANGVIRGAVTITNGGLLRLSTGDATGFGGGPSSLNVINIVGSTLDVNTIANQTLGSATLNLTGGNVTGIAGSNLDFFGNGSALNTLASAASSTISLPTFNLRQNDTIFNIADGAAEYDLMVSSTIGNGSAGNHALFKTGAGTLQLTGISTFTGNVTITAGVVDITTPGAKLYNAGFNNTNIVTIAAGGTLRLEKFTYDVSLGKLADYAARRVIDGGTIEVVGNTHVSGNNFTVSANGGTFRYAPAVGTDTLTLAGNNNSNTTLDGTLTFRTDGNVTSEGIIQGTGGIIKTGSRTLTLANANTYTGATMVSEGSLQLAGGSETSAITVGNGAALGFVAGSPVTSTAAVTLSSGSTVFVSGTPAADTVLLTAASISGTPVLSPGIAGYTLEIQGGNTLVLKSTGADDYGNYIGGYTFAPGADTSRTGDPDGDGLTNFQEYAFGLAPNSGSSVNPITQTLSKSTGLFTYTRRLTSFTGIVYTYEYSTDLATWTTFTPDTTTSDSGNPVEAVTVDVPDALLANPKLFVRVSAK